MVKRLSVFGCILIIICACKEQKHYHNETTPFQKKMNATYKDVTTSPLKPKDLEVFEGLDFFDFDSTYVVKGVLTPTPNSEWFQMPTTTSRVSKERIYGVVTFRLLGELYRLNLYQGEATMTTKGFEDYLFLPFLDATNGFETYGGGRYIDTKIPQGDTLILDFNTAYNPYCAYNENYSCPVVPRANYLKVKVKAGVKAFKSHSY